MSKDILLGLLKLGLYALAGVLLGLILRSQYLGEPLDIWPF